MDRERRTTIIPRHDHRLFQAAAGSCPNGSGLVVGRRPRAVIQTMR